MKKIVFYKNACYNVCINLLYEKLKEYMDMKTEKNILIAFLLNLYFSLFYLIL